MRGRGTRVWEARKLVKNTAMGSSVVIKDSWVDHDKPREGDLLVQLMARLRDTLGVDMKAAASYFLTVLRQGDVYIDGEVDATFSKIMWGTDVQKTFDTLWVRPPGHFTESESTTDNSRSKNSSSVGQAEMERLPTMGRLRTTQLSEVTQGFEYTKHHRSHYRIVFQERGKSLHQIDDLRDRFQALMGATRGETRVNQNCRDRAQEFPSACLHVEMWLYPSGC